MFWELLKNTMKSLPKKHLMTNQILGKNQGFNAFKLIKNSIKLFASDSCMILSYKTLYKNLKYLHFEIFIFIFSVAKKEFGK